jgi:hypothetical protein
MRRRLIVLALVSIFLFPVGSRIVRAQEPAGYVLGLGVKLGSPCAISLKYMIDNRNALELLASGWLRAAGGTLLYEYHSGFSSLAGFRWYIGGGAHCAYAVKNFYNPYSDVVSERGIYSGVDAVLGGEYVFSKIPFSISVDVLPMVNVMGKVSFWWNAGVALRYAFR